MGKGKQMVVFPSLQMTSPLWDLNQSRPQDWLGAVVGPLILPLSIQSKAFAQSWEALLFDQTCSLLEFYVF